VAAGADGVWVSNHGGRQLDGGPSTLAALPEVVAGVAGRLPVFFDGGVRRGADVLKALALGATAVFVGRPLVWALAVDGQQGVEDMLDMLHEELVTAMALTGCASLAAIQRSHVTLPHEPPPRPHSRL
jgi:isopentenyl diphosphate isomerase/L-lactate dehydrogenase-like FMN-dependent dehydrogenase